MKSLQRQVGGAHYKKYVIEPIVYVSKNKIIHTLANIVKYATRANTRSNLRLPQLQKKIDDLQKIIHYAEIEMEFAIEEFKEHGGQWPEETREEYTSPASVPAPAPAPAPASAPAREGSLKTAASMQSIADDWDT